MPGTSSPATVSARPKSFSPRMTPNVFAAHSCHAGLPSSAHHLLGQATEAQQRQLLVATGDYLRRMHAITFTHPGYLMRSDGPARRQPTRIGSIAAGPRRRAQRNALALLAARGPELTPALGDRLHELFASMAERLEATCLLRASCTATATPTSFSWRRLALHRR